MGQSRKLTIINHNGLHARPSAKFVRLAKTFSSTIAVYSAGQSVNGKSIIEMMMLAATQGSQIELHAEGQDEQQALAALSHLVIRGFDE